MDAVSVIVPLKPGEPFRKTFTGEAELIIERRGTHPAEARNLGAARSRSPIMLFLDGDMDLEGLDLTSLSLNGFDLATAYYDTPHAQDWVNVNLQNVLAAMRSPLAFIGGFMLMKRQVFNALEGFRRVPLEDVEFAVRAFWRGFKLGAIPVKAVHTRPFNHKDVLKPLPLSWGL